MEQVLRLAMILALVLSIAATSFAAVNRNPKLKSVYRVEKQSTKRNFRQSGRHGAKKIGYKSRTSAPRVRRLTRHQIRDFYRRMLDISVN